MFRATAFAAIVVGVLGLTSALTVGSIELTRTTFAATAAPLQALPSTAVETADRWSGKPPEFVITAFAILGFFGMATAWGLTARRNAKLETRYQASVAEQADKYLALLTRHQAEHLRAENRQRASHHEVLAAFRKELNHQRERDRETFGQLERAIRMWNSVISLRDTEATLLALERAKAGGDLTREELNRMHAYLRDLEQLIKANAPPGSGLRAGSASDFKPPDLVGLFKEEEDK